MIANVKLDHEPVGDGGWLLRVLLKIEGEARPPADRTPLNLSLVLDRSGSMGGPKLAAAKAAAALVARRLAPSDTLSVVAYDNRIMVVAPPATGAEQTDLPRLIESITVGGSTNLSGGWLKGRKLVADEAAKGRDDAAVNRVLLLTDGLANVGITDPAKLVGLCRQAAADGVTTTTIGFGADYDEDLLSAMADAGGGGAYYIEQPDQAPAVFAEELAGLLSIAAQNVRVEISIADAVESCRVLHTYPSSEHKELLSLDLGDLYAREPRPVLAEFLINPSVDGVDGALTAEGVSAETSRGEIPVGTMVVMGDVLTADGGIEERTICIPIRLSPVEGGIAEPEVRRELILLEAAREREKALEARTAEEYMMARETLWNVSEQLMAFDPEDRMLAEEASDLRLMDAAMEDASLDAADRKYMHYRAQYARRGRREAVESLSRQKWEKRRDARGTPGAGEHEPAPGPDADDAGS